MGQGGCSDCDWQLGSHFDTEAIERAAARRLWQKWGAGKYHTDRSEPLLAIDVGVKQVDVVAPDLPGNWDLTVGEEGVTFLIEKIVSCYKSTL